MNTATGLISGIRQIQQMREEIKTVISFLASHDSSIRKHLIDTSYWENGWSIGNWIVADRRDGSWSIRYSCNSYGDRTLYFHSKKEFFNTPAAWVSQIHSDLSILIDGMASEIREIRDAIEPFLKVGGTH